MDVTPVVAGVGELAFVVRHELLGLDVILDVVAAGEWRGVEEDGRVGRGHAYHKSLEVEHVVRSKHIEFWCPFESSSRKGVDDSCTSM